MDINPQLSVLLDNTTGFWLSVGLFSPHCERGGQDLSSGLPRPLFEVPVSSEQGGCLPLISGHFAILRIIDMIGMSWRYENKA